MPEALAILFIFVTAVGVYVFAWVQSRNPALHSPEKESVRLGRHLAWLEHRLALARQKKWGDEMIASLATEQAVTANELARVQAVLKANAAVRN